MNDIRNAVIALITDSVKDLPNRHIRNYADQLASDVGIAARDFCKLFGYGRRFAKQIISVNVSVPYELYQVIKDREQLSGENQTKEAVPQGTK